MGVHEGRGPSNPQRSWRRGQGGEGKLQGLDLGKERTRRKVKNPDAAVVTPKCGRGRGFTAKRVSCRDVSAAGGPSRPAPPSLVMWLWTSDLRAIRLAALAHRRSGLGAASASAGCRNRLPQTEWLKQQRSIFSQLSSRSSRPMCQGFQFLMRALFLW